MAKIKYHSAEAVKELQTLVQEFKNMKTAVTDTGSASQVSLQKLEKKLFSIQMLSGKTVKAINRLNDSISKNAVVNNKSKKAIEGTTAALNKQIAKLRQQQRVKAKDNETWLAYELKIKAVREKLRRLTLTQSKYISSVKKQTVANKVATKSIKTKTTALKALRNTFGLFLGLNFLKDVASTIFKMTKDFDSLRFSMEKIVDTSFDLESSQRFLLKISEDYGVELLATSQRYVKFLASAKQSNLSLADTEKIFGSVTKAASVLGLKTDELTSVYLALEQMLSKGKVSTEELRRQLGERLPGAMGIMAAALDVSIPKLDQMLKKGEVLSADALPKFAEAIELAFGISNVDKIENLVTAQNRLATSWQIWIQDLSEGENSLSIFFQTAINYANELIKKISALTASPKLVLQSKIITEDRYENNMLDIEADQIYEERIGALVDFEKRKTKLFNISLLEYHDFTKAEKDLHDKKVADILKLEKKQQNEINLIKKEIAENGITEASKEFAQNKFLYEKELKQLSTYRQELAELQKEQSKTGNFITDAFDKDEIKARQVILDKIDAQKSKIDDLGDSYASTTALFDIYRKLLQKSNVSTLPGGGSNKNTKKQLKEIQDLQNKIDVEKLQSSISLNKLLLKSEEILIEDKKQLLLDISKYEIEIAKIQNKDKDDVNRIKYDKEIKALKKYLLEGKITQIEFDKQSLDLLKEKNQKLELEDLSYNKKVKSSKLKLGSDLIKILQEQQKAEIDIIKNKYDLEIIELDRVYEKSGKTSRDWKRLEEGKRDVAIRMANEIIDSKIAILEAEKAGLNQSEENIASIQRSIDALNAARKRLNPDKTDILTWQDWLEKIGEVLNEVGTLVDAIFDRRIANIDAEINAEEKKYDRLIALAENDAAEKESLEKQKADSIAILEAKRLKEERKAAKIRKAFAIAEIGINTAVAISEASPNPVLIALAAAIGAIQLATVIATPIPQYADGIDSVPNNQVAMINDGGKKEYVERDGKILSTNTKNAIVNLKKNDTVHKDYESMKNNSNIYSVIANGEILKQNEFDKLSQIMESAIIKGFSKSKINNNISFKNNNKNSDYINRKSRFN